MLGVVWWEWMWVDFVCPHLIGKRVVCVDFQATGFLGSSMSCVYQWVLSCWLYCAFGSDERRVVLCTRLSFSPPASAFSSHSPRHYLCSFSLPSPPSLRVVYFSPLSLSPPLLPLSCSPILLLLLPPHLLFLPLLQGSRVSGSLSAVKARAPVLGGVYMYQLPQGQKFKYKFVQIHKFIINP